MSKRKLLLIFFFFLLLANLNANSVFGINLRAVIVIASEEIGREENLAMVNAFLDELDKYSFITVDRLIIGKDFDNDPTNDEVASKENFIGAIRDSFVSDDSVFFVYWNGHGAITSSGERFIATHGGITYIEELEEEILKKPSRLKILITDTCSSYSDTELPEALNIIPPIMSDSDSKNIYHRLFLYYTGFLHLTSATEGEAAWRTSEGSYFTTALFKYTLLQNPLLTWEANFERTKELTNKYSTKKQTPKYYSLPVYKPNSNNKSQNKNKTKPKNKNKNKNNINKMVELHIEIDFNQIEYAEIGYDKDKIYLKRDSAKPFIGVIIAIKDNKLTLKLVGEIVKDETNYLVIETTHGTFTIYKSNFTINIIKPP
ncbi:MAG: caspase family protein [Spirochaetota bacterium]